MMPHELMRGYCRKCKGPVDKLEVNQSADGYESQAIAYCHEQVDEQTINLLNVGSSQGLDGLLEFFEADPEPVKHYTESDHFTVKAFDVWYDLCGKMVRWHGFPLTKSEAYDRVALLQERFEWDDAQADEKIKVTYHNPWGSFPVFPTHPELQAIYELYVRIPPDTMPHEVKGVPSTGYDLFWRGCLARAYQHGKSGGKCDNTIQPLSMAHAAWLAGSHAGGHDEG